MLTRSRFALGVFTAALSMNIAAADWSYSGDTGPSTWGSLNKAYQLCSNGKHQSPINIEDTKSEDLPTLKHLYLASKLNIENTGHSLKVKVDNGSYMQTKEGKTFLREMHWHTPSEHKLDDDRYPLEVHLVHSDEQQNISVFAVLFEEGDANPALQLVLDNAPASKGKKLLKDINIDANDVIARTKTEEYYLYAGSLTTPPCTEGVRWYVAAEPSEASEEQIKKLRQMFVGGNARPIQPLNERTVFESD